MRMAMADEPRRDFDFVTMADYAADMRESADHAASIISELNRRVRDRERIIKAAALSAGGTLRISDGDLQDADQATIEIWNDDFDLSRKIKVTRT